MQKGLAVGQQIPMTIKPTQGRGVTFMFDGIRTTIFVKDNATDEEAIERYKRKIYAAW